jgi:uncharacterized protein YndB with AHSA1/START domain
MEPKKPKGKFVAEAEIIINATAPKVWKALTDPKEVKKYFFNTNLIVKEWKEGAPIRYRGVWEGKEYEDKGTILKYEPEQLLVTTYWSDMGGKPDKPENYNTVTYKLSPAEQGTKVTILQDNIDTEESKKHSEENWKMVLEKLKKLLEGKNVAMAH